jgi:hypothetical protein
MRSVTTSLRSNILVQLTRTRHRRYLSIFLVHVLWLTLNRYQSELEHRTSKARFSRTNGRLIPMQLSKIERRQSRIRRIRETTQQPLHQTDVNDNLTDPRAQYNMGKTQNSPVHLPTFLHKNNDDPAIKVSRAVPFSSFFFLLSSH